MAAGTARGGGECADIWDDLDALLAMLCTLMPCSSDRVPDVATGLSQVEADAWRITLTYEANGLRPNLTPDEKLVGAAAVVQIRAVLDAHTNQLNPTVETRFRAALGGMGADLAQ
jgi:hypothetical protein